MIIFKIMNMSMSFIKKSTSKNLLLRGNTFLEYGCTQDEQRCHDGDERERPFSQGRSWCEMCSGLLILILFKK